MHINPRERLAKAQPTAPNSPNDATGSSVRRAFWPVEPVALRRATHASALRR
jgi:hypothetical protein